MEQNGKGMGIVQRYLHILSNYSLRINRLIQSSLAGDFF